MPETLPSADFRARVEGPPNRKRFTRRDCDFLRSNGLLTGRYELIDGDVISKMGQSPRHRLVINLVAAALRSIFGELSVQIQGTVDIDIPDPDINEPEPDVSVTAEPNTAYADRHPLPREIVLAVEVSDTTLRFDMGNKARLYAQSGIRDYWTVDLNGRRILVCREPGPEGYASILQYSESETISPLARPEAAVDVSTMLPAP